MATNNKRRAISRSHTPISLRLIKKKPVGISDSVIYENFIASFIYIKKLFGSILDFFPLFVLPIKLRDAMKKKKNKVIRGLIPFTTEKLIAK